VSEKLWLEIESMRASLGYTKRWHTLPQINSTNVAEHSGQAVSLLLLLHPNPSMNLVKSMLWHDSSERVAGDVPAPVRRAHPDFAKMYEFVEYGVMADNHPSAMRAMHVLTEDEQRWLKAIDVLELVMHCTDQMMLGNTHAAIVRERGLGYLRRQPAPDMVLEFVDHYMSKPGGPRSFA